MKAQAIVVKNDDDSAGILFGDRLGSEMEQGWYASIWHFDTFASSRKDEFLCKEPYQGPFPTPKAALAAVTPTLVINSGK